MSVTCDKTGTECGRYIWYCASEVHWINKPHCTDWMKSGQGSIGIPLTIKLSWCKLGPQIKQDQCLIWAYKSAWLAGASSSSVLFNLRTHFSVSCIVLMLTNWTWCIYILWSNEGLRCKYVSVSCVSSDQMMGWDENILPLIIKPIRPELTIENW